MASHADPVREASAAAPSREEAAPRSPAPAGGAAAVLGEAPPGPVAPAAPRVAAKRSTLAEDRGNERDLEGAPRASAEPATKPDEPLALAPAAPPAPVAQSPGRAKAGPPSASGRVVADGDGSASATARGAPAPDVRTEVLDDPDCPGERTRTLVRDADGRLVRRERSGTRAGGAWRAIEHFGSDGRLVEARVWQRGSQILLDRDTLDRLGLERLHDLDLAPEAVTAVQAPPACR
jgi:hypothetical protein